MILKRETVLKTMIEFCESNIWDIPERINTPEKLSKYVDAIYPVYEDMFGDESFVAASLLAKKQARRFPCPADFYVGFEPPKRIRFDA